MVSEVTTKWLKLRRADACRACGAQLPVGSAAWWDDSTRTVTCESCHGTTRQLTAASEKGPKTPSNGDSTPVIRAGVAGGSAEEEYQRRHKAREARLDAKFGRFAGIVKFLSDDPSSITAWKKGSIGERKFAASLQENLGDRVILLNDRRVPRTRGNIDHLVISSSGVWVVDAKNYTGLVKQRDVGGFFRVDMRLYVGGRDRTKTVDGLAWQVAAVVAALGDADVPVYGAVCFTDAEWGFFAKPFIMKDVFISGPNALSRRIAEVPQLSTERIRTVAARLSEALPPKV